MFELCKEPVEKALLKVATVKAEDEGSERLAHDSEEGKELLFVHGLCEEVE